MSANVNATHSTLCPRSSESLYIVTYYTKWVLLLGNTVRVSSRTAPSFCVQFKTRNNNQVKRDETILLFAKVVKELNPEAAVEFKTPDICVIVEIIRNICCIGICKDYYKYKKYNLSELATKDDPKSAEADLKSTEADLKSTEADLKSTEADLKSTEADLKSTEADLKSTEAVLKSPKADPKSTKADLISAEADKAEEKSNGDNPKAENAAESADKEAGSCINEDDIQNNGCDTAEAKVKESKKAEESPENLNK